MTFAQIVNDYWWALVVILLIIIAIFWFKKKKGKTIKLCKHKWDSRNAFVVTKNGKDYIRICYVCLKCGTGIHKQLHSYDELKEKEKELFNG